MIERYLKIVNWARTRYTRNGLLVISVGNEKSVFTRIENAAWSKYIDGVKA